VAIYHLLKEKKAENKTKTRELRIDEFVFIIIPLWRLELVKNCKW